MSSSIFYRKQFIKIDDNTYLPIIEMGSSNCYDMDNRRSRSWSNAQFSFMKDIFVHADQINEQLDGFLKKIVDGHPSVPQEQVKKQFGWYTAFMVGGYSTSKTTFSMFKSIFTAGIKNAMTVEELVKEGVSVKIHEGYRSSRELSPEGLRAEYPKTSQELSDLIQVFHNHYKDSEMGFYVDFGSGIDRMLDRKKGNNKLQKKTEKKRQDFAFVLKDKDYNFFGKKLKWGYKYYGMSYWAKKFKSQAQAESYLKKLNELEFYLDKSFKVEQIQGDFYF